MSLRKLTWKQSIDILLQYVNTGTLVAVCLCTTTNSQCFTG